MADGRETHFCRKIVVTPGGPYFVLGDIPLVRKIQVVSEHGEPLAWRKEGTLATPAFYALCRCGQSGAKPFCDGTHCRIGFDGTETADTGGTAERQVRLPGGTGLVVKCDESLCIRAGFCATRSVTVRDLVAASADTNARSQAIAMVERCPSGALTYATGTGTPDLEPDLPAQVAVTTEMTSDGPIAGSLWVTGMIPVERADGRLLETRNRVTLCCCGQSKNKPLCDGTHRPKEGEPADGR